MIYFLKLHKNISWKSCSMKYAMLFHSHVDMFMHWHILNNNEILGKIQKYFIVMNCNIVDLFCSYIDVFCCVGKYSWKYVKCLSLQNNLLLPKWWKKWKLLFHFWTIHVL